MGDRRSRFREDRDGGAGGGSSVEVSVGDGGRMCCVICVAERWYVMTVKSMGSGSAWCG